MHTSQTVHVTSDALQQLAFDNRAEITLHGDYSVVTIGGTDYVAKVEQS